jgi:hypothetical protein
LGVRIAAQQSQREHQRSRSGLVPGQQKDLHLIPDFVVGQYVVAVAGGNETADQILPRRCGGAGRPRTR